MICTEFLSIYPYLYLNEASDVTNKCMEFIIQNTGNTLFYHLKADIKVNKQRLANFASNPFEFYFNEIV